MPTTEIVNLAHVAGQPQLSIHTYDMAFGGASTGDMGTKAAVQLPGLAAPVTLMGNHQCPTPLAHQVQQVQRHRLRLWGCRSATNHETERQQNAEGASAGLRRSSTPLMGAHHSYSGCWLLQQGCCTATSRPHPTRQWPNTRQMFTLASPVFPAHRSSEIGSVHRLTVPLACHPPLVTLLLLSQRLGVALSMRRCSGLNSLVLQQCPACMTWAYPVSMGPCMHDASHIFAQHSHRFVQHSSCCLPCRIYTTPDTAVHYTRSFSIRASRAQPEESALPAARRYYALWRHYKAH